MLRKLITTTNDILPLILRLTLGVVFFPHGAQKVLGWFGGGGFGATLQAMAGMGLPKALVLMVMTANFCTRYSTPPPIAFRQSVSARNCVSTPQRSAAVRSR